MSLDIFVYLDFKPRVFPYTEPLNPKPRLASLCRLHPNGHTLSPTPSRASVMPYIYVVIIYVHIYIYIYLYVYM